MDPDGHAPGGHDQPKVGNELGHRRSRSFVQDGRQGEERGNWNQQCPGGWLALARRRPCSIGRCAGHSSGLELPGHARPGTEETLTEPGRAPDAIRRADSLLPRGKDSVAAPAALGDVFGRARPPCFLRRPPFFLDLRLDLLLSMTGFGDSRLQDPRWSIEVEVRTMNNRHFKLSARISEPYSTLEAEFERLVAEKVRAEPRN